MGASADEIGAALREGRSDDMDLGAALRLAVRTLAGVDDETREIAAAALEVAVLDRTRPRRTFRRLSDVAVAEILAGG
jgi:proteasome alpha subunit